jgi:hypothetical protein
MKIVEVLVRVMSRLGDVPGLTFLGGYVVSAKAQHTRFGQRKGDYEAYINNVRGAGGIVREAAGGPGQAGDDEVEDHDGGPVEHDDYDDDDDDFDSVYGEGSNDSIDDYPASDENNSYFDDDYLNQ